jgi:hypothetical protein
MQRSSETIGAIAAALAKAQAELPRSGSDVSLRGAVKRPRHRAQGARRPRDRDRPDHRDRQGGRADPPHHHARPCVGRVAVVGMAGVPARETSAPRRMGAALTYARRYALFTFVGIAGEDDLDAPDLAQGAKTNAADKADAADREGVAARLRSPAAVEERLPVMSAAPGGQEKFIRPARVVLGTEQSAALRERLLASLGQLQSAEEAADRVHANLAAKNTLIAADAEAAGSASPVEKSVLAATDDTAAASIIRPSGPGARRRRVMGKTIRLHCKFVGSQPCIVCGRTPSEAHDIRFAQPRALGRKVSGEYTVPVCRLHHRDLHN